MRTNEFDHPNDHLFVPVKAQTGCARCGYARGQHPTAALLRRFQRDLTTTCTDSPTCARNGCADRERSYGPQY
jgi:hypothetical protein